MKSPLRLIASLLGLVAVLVMVGCNTSTSKKDYEVMIARFRIEAEVNNAFATVTLPVSGVQIGVDAKPVVTEFDYSGVEVAQSDMGKFLVFYLTSDAARDVYRLTTSNQGKRLVLFVNEKPVGARVIDGPFNTGAIAVFAAVDDELLIKLAKNLNDTAVDLQKKLAKEKS